MVCKTVFHPDPELLVLLRQLFCGAMGFFPKPKENYNYIIEQGRFGQQFSDELKTGDPVLPKYLGILPLNCTQGRATVLVLAEYMEVIT